MKERPRRKPPANGSAQATHEHQGKLVLLFFILVVGVYTVIIQNRLFLPVHDAGPAYAQTHRKHMRVENLHLREQFQKHKISTASPVSASVASNSPPLKLSPVLDPISVSAGGQGQGGLEGGGSDAEQAAADTSGDQQDRADKPQLLRAGDSSAGQVDPSSNQRQRQGMQVGELAEEQQQALQQGERGSPAAGGGAAGASSGSREQIESSPLPVKHPAGVQLVDGAGAQAAAAQHQAAAAQQRAADAQQHAAAAQHQAAGALAQGAAAGAADAALQQASAAQQLAAEAQQHAAAAQQQAAAGVPELAWPEVKLDAAQWDAAQQAARGSSQSLPGGQAAAVTGDAVLGPDALPQVRSHLEQQQQPKADVPVVKLTARSGAGRPVQPEPPEVWARRRDQVREAMAHSWAAYEQYAWGQDELQPLTQEGKNSLGGLGATIVDSLDTLWLFGMQEEFARARAWVAEKLEFASARRINLFETNIRIIGGLLAAFDLSGDMVFLSKAEELMQRILSAFENQDNHTVASKRPAFGYTDATLKAGIPHNMLSLQPLGSETRRRAYGGTMVALAEYGSFGVEFLALSERTGNPVYQQKAENIYRFVHDSLPHTGLVATRLNRKRGTLSAMKTYTVGAMADSYYEYLLKMWLLKEQQDEMYRVMWVRFVDDTIARLVDHSVGGLTYVGQLQQNDVFMPHLEHLSCFLPGNIALGVHYGAVAGAKAALYMELAQNLTYTCWQMYERMPTGLAPETVWFHPQSDMQVGTHPNQLRPEIIESFFYLWRFTGDERYRDWGWQSFQAFEEHCRTDDSGYAGVEDVTVVPPTRDNTQQTFWMAETLKYLWLLFSEPSELPLDEWVLNTEAHPVRARTKLQPAARPAA